jgi:valyl-tRNA synthetase
LADKAIKVVKEGKIKITPKSFENVYFSWLENLRDWNISRQIVWGIRIPAWLCEKCSNWEVTEGLVPEKCSKCNSKEFVRDTDTFDTWFSSGQWPYLTLETGKPDDFDKFYPTDVMETAYDILKAWVTRMVMLGLYITGEVPFKNVLFHGIVNDPYGKKMSKSKGNVVNPLELVEQYGADAVRFALIYGNATGNDQALSYTKLDAARKFTNKLWNIARFIQMNKPEETGSTTELSNLEKKGMDGEMVQKVGALIKEISMQIETFHFNLAAERLYEFIWHEFADKYIEDVKTRITPESYTILCSLFITQLKLLHPIMPFVTEELHRQLGGKKSIMIEHWPENV